ncbi:MAG: hypothetical protein AB1916_06870 [Thermodesulfobacteriota bacterium]
MSGSNVAREPALPTEQHEGFVRAATLEWIRQARQLGVARRPQYVWPANLDGFQGLCNELVRIAHQEVESLLRRSDDLLQPLGDPFRIDFPLNRWLAGAREEAYSDWLAWAVGRLSPREVMEVFCLQVPDDLADEVQDLPVQVEREVYLPYTNGNKSGRIDLTVKMGTLMLVIEMKTTPVGQADTAKQQEYFKALESHTLFAGKARRYVLLATSEDRQGECIDCFTYLPLSAACRNLRGIVRKRLAAWRAGKACNHVNLALILALVGAIETNLLGLSVSLRGHNQRTIDHLRNFIAQGGN